MWLRWKNRFSPADPIRVGHNRQLFLTGHLIEERDGLTRRVCPVVKHPDNPIIRPREQWEPAGYLARSVIYDPDEGIYKAWHAGVDEAGLVAQPREGLSSAVYYFTSEDGIHWDRPALEPVGSDGGDANTCSLTARNGAPGPWPYFRELFSVIRDPTDPDPQRRYKMGFLHKQTGCPPPYDDPFKPGERRGLGVAFSPDGVHWTPVDDMVTRATCDGTTQCLHEPDKGRFVLYGRARYIAPEVQRLWGEERFFQGNHGARAVRRAESTDFIHWTPDEGRIVLATDMLDGPGEEIYGMAVFPYEGIYIGLVQVFHNYEDVDYLDIQLAVSRDGVEFERLSDRSPFIPVGEVGSWDRFNTNFCSSVPLAVGDELLFYYGGRNCRHRGAYKGTDDGRNVGLSSLAGVGLGTVKRDRFAGLVATFDPGTLLTKRLLLEGTRLHVNASVPFGVLEVALTDADGQVIEGTRRRIQETDGVDILLPGNLPSALIDRPVRLEFKLQNGTLYSFRVD